MLSPYAKAVVAGIVAALSALTPLADDGISVADVLACLVAGLVGSGFTYAVPNAPKAQDEGGSVDIAGALIVVILVLVVLALLGVRINIG